MCFLAPNSHQLATDVRSASHRTPAPALSPGKLRLRAPAPDRHQPQQQTQESVRHLDKLISIYCYLFSKPLVGNKTQVILLLFDMHSVKIPANDIYLHRTVLFVFCQYYSQSFTINCTNNKLQYIVSYLMFAVPTMSAV